MSKWICKFAKLSSCDSISDKVFYTRMLISFFCIMVCMAAMLSSAYAWFLVDVSSGENVLSSANYSVEVSTDNEDSNVEMDNNSYIYYCDLVQEDNHYFTLTATGTAKNGYCEMIITSKIDGEDVVKTYDTAHIGQGKKLKVCVQAAQGCSIQFVPVWAAAETASTFSLGRTDVFNIQHSTTPYVEYLVVEGVTLEALADYYGVLMEDICIYNGITELIVGETIKIPGVEDDSIEPYNPMLEVATPSNATKVEIATSSDASSVETMTPSDASREETEQSDTASDANASVSQQEDSGWT